MSAFTDAAREARGYRYLETAARLFDRKPLQCSLYVTDQCNLDCAYCTEYDNSRPHPATADLKLWLRKIRDLGTVRVALVGGEPLMHPDIVDLVAYAREIGLATSLTTNGFLLTRELLQQLDDAGLQVMQISVDRMTPSEVTRKSFKTILPKLDLFKDSRVNLHITGVLCADTVGESRQVLDTGLSRGIPTEVRLVHADREQHHRVDPGAEAQVQSVLDWMSMAKAAGAKVHTNDAILDYQQRLLQGKQVEWTCTAGFKIFFVSASGQFWLCSMRSTDKHILQVTLEDLQENYRKKSCQDGCGVYCVVSTSMIYEQPLRIIGREAWSRLRRLVPAPAPAQAY